MHPSLSPAQARAATGLSREQVAAAAGISFQTVWRCEKTGKWPRSIPIATAMRRALGVPPPPIPSESQETP